MTDVLIREAEPKSVAVTQRVFLYDVSWRTYELLLADLQDRESPRLAFDRGMLEIMSPSWSHEEVKSTITEIVGLTAAVLDRDYRSFGSVTLKRSDLQRGFEPDACFYIANVDRIKGKRLVDLTRDPAPDLVIEIDYSSSSMAKLPLYAQLGVSEVWQIQEETIRILALVQGEYEERSGSVSLPVLTGERIRELLALSATLRRPQWQEQVREQARQGLPLPDGG